MCNNIFTQTPLTGDERDKYFSQMIAIAATINYVRLCMDPAPELGPDHPNREWMQMLNDSLNSFVIRYKKLADEIGNRTGDNGFIDFIIYTNAIADTTFNVYKNYIAAYQLKTGVNMFITLSGCIVDPFECLKSLLMKFVNK